jgi:ATP-dependent Clp protease adaptor protein ClpS
MSKQNNPSRDLKGEGMLEMHNEGDNFLILYNDDVNSFDYIIDSLVEVCEHDAVQAEQCTYIAHHKGKCDVKRGTIARLNPLRAELSRRGIVTTIE